MRSQATTLLFAGGWLGLCAVTAQAQEPLRPRTEPAPVLAPGRAFLYSAAVPGSAQRRLGLERWLPYAAVDAWGLLTYLDRRREGGALESRYRDLAWVVARRVSSRPRRDGDFEYYEALTKYGASGAYDLDPSSPQLWPEMDEETYNGAIWALARAIYLPAGDDRGRNSPEFRAALAYYEARAIGPEYAWAWGDNGLEQQAYTELIRRSDEAFRSATRALGLILANHLVSAVDALISARLRADGVGHPPVELESAFEPDGEALRWRAGVRIGLPRR